MAVKLLIMVVAPAAQVVVRTTACLIATHRRC